MARQGREVRQWRISNCDIVWVVVAFDETAEPGKATLTIHDTIFTTLEDAVKGLTAGDPTTLSEFEAKLDRKVRVTLPPKETRPLGSTVPDEPKD